MKLKQLLSIILELSFKKKIEFLRLFFRELQEVKLGGQQRSNRGKSTHNWKKTARDSIVVVNTHSNVLSIHIYVILTLGVIKGHKRSNSVI